jgi:hypothetical protein
LALARPVLQTLAMGLEFGLLEGQFAAVLFVFGLIERLPFERLVLAPETFDLPFERLVLGMQIVVGHRDQSVTSRASSVAMRAAYPVLR